MKKLLFIFAAVIISVTGLKAQKNNKASFNKIAETTVDFSSAKNAVTINGADTYKSLRIKADAPVHIESMQVIYETGEPENIPIRYDFKTGIESRNIDLKGSDRKIKEIDFVYRKVQNLPVDKANLEILGSK